MIKRIALLVMLLLLSFPTPALAAGEPAITGKVVNGTAGGGPVGGLDVTLTTYVDSAPSDQQTASVDSDGNFQFGGLSMNATYSYDISTTYEGVPYTSDMIQLTTANATQAANVQVYETTNDNSAVQMSTGHMIIVPMSQGLLNVLEIWAFENSSDKTYTGATGDSTHSTSQFTLPSGATNFSSDTGISANITTGIVTDSLPILPGSNSIGFAYSLTYQGNNADITLKSDYPTPSFSMLAPQNGITGKSTTLSQQAPQNIQGTNYLYFTGSNIQKGQNIDITLNISAQAFSASPSGSTTSSSPVSVSWLWVAVIALLVVAGGVFVYMMKQRTPQPLGIDGQIEQLRQQLLLDIARLDDDFENGKIEKEAYTKLRAERKTQLVGLMQGSKEESGNG